jgi:hypothetical protein
LDSKSDFKHATIETAWGYITVPLKREQTTLDEMEDFARWCETSRDKAKTPDRRERFQRRIDIARKTILKLEGNRGDCK